MGGAKQPEGIEVPEGYRLISEDAYANIKKAADRAAEARRERDEALQELAQVRETQQRREAFATAGVDLSHELGEIALKVYRGEPTAEAVSAWIGDGPLDRVVLESLYRRTGRPVEELHEDLENPAGWITLVE